MDYYIDVTIKPDAEMRENVLLNLLYTKLHKAMFEMTAEDIGVSFPTQKTVLGRVLRIHATLGRLQELEAMSWRGGLDGYCDVGKVLAVPENCQYRTLYRKQPTMTLSKLRRLANRGSITPEAAKDYKAQMFAKGLDNPYLELVSASNGHKHRRYIELGALSGSAVAGSFDYFGFSRTATIPWF